MKNKLNYIHLLLFFITASFLTVSCGKNSADEGPDDDPTGGNRPSIASISPERGTAGTIITLTGTGFGSDPSDVRVQFSSVEVRTVISVTDTQIEVEAPAGFSDRTVNVRAIASKASSNVVDFYYIDATAPSITSTTATCFYNSSVVIIGSNFSPNKDDNIVKFGTVEATVTEASRTSLTVTTPDLGDATDVDITVTKFDLISNAHNITVDIDQNKVATYAWTTHIVRSGVEYKTGEFSLFGSDIRKIHVLDVTLNETNTLGIGFNDPGKSTVALCRDNEAIAGVNAGYFPLGGASDKDPYIRINGTTIQDGHLGVSQIFTNSALLIHNNVATIRKFTESGTNLNQTAAAIPVSEAENIIVCGPMLIVDGVIENLNMETGHNNAITGRTGLGVTADGKQVFMVVIEYRTNGTTPPKGMTTLELAKVLQALGSINAMNLDGGGSSTMFVEGQGTDGRVSVNGSSMRSIRSVIYVK
ncbi:phosphodiester glycosidase family protein [Sphingobacterium chuzhouense]|uniref:Phosphodiester glycosidase family protein n=1 Tax=Sphingobacterium chuzhouense TaxID=1742264 RepID=A0ABR7XLX2_9SPHI|nr:phosphodiester glycosidase family protein [Sphingobacterium chuzhouense]MBD1420178.1 phosphodiester glycosidase family protein [Sphingobacterium chuzhouense]